MSALHSSLHKCAQKETATVIAMIDRLSATNKHTTIHCGHDRKI